MARRALREHDVPRRALVPTPRLEGLEPGGDDGSARPQPAAGAQSEGPRRRLASWLRGADPRSIEGSKRPLVALALWDLVMSWELAAGAVLVFEMRVDFGFDLAFLATLGSIAGVLRVALAPVMGYLADRVSRVWMLRVSMIATLVALVGVTTADTLAQLVLMRVLAGVASAPAAALFPLMCDWYASKDRTKVFGALDIATRFATIFGPIIAGLIAERYGWRPATLISVALAALALAALFAVREPARGYIDRLEMSGSEDVAQREQRPLGWAASWRAVRSIITLRRLWYATPFLYIGSFGSLTLMAAYFTDVFHLGPGARGVIAGASGVTAFIAVVSLSPVADGLLRSRPARVMTYGGLVALVQALTFFLLGAVPNLGIALFLSLVVGAIAAVTGVAGFAVMSLVTPARVRGLGLGIGQLWQLPGFVLLPIVLGWSIGFGVQRAMFVFVPLLVLGGILVISSGAGVARDIRAARAAAMADEEVTRARANAQDQMLVVRDVDVTYDGTQVLFNVSCNVGAGEIVALLGTNGAGKSTLLRAIVGIQEASNGAIFVDGEDVTHAPPHENARRGIVMVPGGHAVFPTLTVAENLNTAVRAAGLEGEEARARIDEVLALFPSLRERMSARAGDLSGGEQQMLALGQAFVSKPRLLMIDELSLGLAPAVVDHLVQTVRRIHEQGTTVLLVEQSINVALTIAERAIFMEKGEIRFDGPVAELMRRPDLVRAVFMGGALGGGAPATSPQRRRADDAEPVVQAEHVSVRYGGVEALRDASISAAAGEIVGIIGPNGAGKTTLFDVLAGHAVPTSGTVTINGTDVTSAPPHARAIAGLGRSFQDARLFGSLTVRECIALALERRLRVRNPILAAVWAPPARADERRVRRRVDALIRALGLRAYADKFVSELSTGTRRAVDMACIMAAEPAAVLLDEPSSGLAQAEAEALAPLLTTLVRETGCAMLVVEHDLPLIASIADRLVAMDLGSIVVTGTPAEVLADQRVVSSYLAASDEILARSDLGILTSSNTR